jgi:hypothetical protein
MRPLGLSRVRETITHYIIDGIMSGNLIEVPGGCCWNKMRTRGIAVFAESSLGPLLKWALLALVATMGGCTPQIVKFYVTVPITSAPPPETEITAHQGTIHVCPDTSVVLSWEVKGHGSLSATSGPRYQPPTCFSVPRIPSKGTQVTGVCADDAVFRLTASHTFWRHSGYCPGPGCPNADREVIVASALEEPIGNITGDIRNGAYEVTNTKPTIDWDDRYRLGTVSVVGLPIATTLQQTPGSSLTVSHDGREAAFNANALTSDVFHGGNIVGTWALRLSGSPSPPIALTMTAHVNCAK